MADKVNSWLAKAAEGLAKDRPKEAPAKKKLQMRIRPTDDEDKKAFIVEHNNQDGGTWKEFSVGSLKDLHGHLDEHYGKSEAKEPAAEEKVETAAQERAEKNA